MKRLPVKQQASLVCLVIGSLLTVTVGSPLFGQSATAIVPGRPVVERLTDDLPTLEDGSHYRLYRLSGDRGDMFRIDLSSTDYVPYLSVFDLEGLDLFDYPGDGSRIAADNRAIVHVKLQRATDVFVLASSYRPGVVGAFNLQVRQFTAEPGGDFDRPAPTTTTVAGAARGTTPLLAAGEFATGRLADGDDSLRSGEFFHRYRFQGLADHVVTLDLRSDDFDTYLILVDPDGEQVDVDDSRGTSHSYLEQFLSVDGEYDVLVTSYGAEEVGAYSLFYQHESVEVAEIAEKAVIAVNGRLTRSDPTLQEGEHVHRYTFAGRRGERVSFNLHSNDFDAYLILENPAGSWVEQNDDAQSGSTDAGIQTRLSSNGVYTLLVTSYHGGEVGSYTLESNKAFASVPSNIAETAPTDDTAAGLTPGSRRTTARAAAGGPQYHGIFVGISDYPGSGSDLDYCADDAINLQRAFQEQQLLINGGSVVLTDGQATRANILNAVATTARRMGPSDRLVFFYSGHGSSDHGRSGDTYESLSVYGGSITDSELAEALHAVEGRVTMVVDACYSGGLAKEVITRPGWIGFFSSDRDVVSYVASRFRAGGYLSYFFQQAVTGEADGAIDGRTDGIITMAELERYLLATWYSPMGPSEDSFQHLKVERNGVGVNEVLFHLR